MEEQIRHIALLAIFILIVFSGCATPVYVTGNTPQPHERVRVCAARALESRGYQPWNSGASESVFKWRKQTSGLGMFDETRTYDVLTVRLAEGEDSTTQVRISAVTESYTSSMYGPPKRKGLSPSERSTSDAESVLGICTGEVAPKFAFAVWQQTDRGIERYLTANDTSELWFDQRISQFSSSQQKVAWSFQGVDSAGLAVGDLRDGRYQVIHKSPADYRYTFGWSPDHETLAVGFFNEREEKGRYLPDDGGIFIVDSLGSVRDIGCSVSREFHGWVGDDRLAVGDGNYLFIVDPSNCETLATVATQEGQIYHYGYEFSPDGRSVFYRSSDGALYLASWNGTEQEVLAAPQYKATNASWSPDSRSVVFEVASRLYADYRHLAIRSVSDSVSHVIVEQDPRAGLADDRNPIFHPTKSELVFDRVWMKGHPGGTIRQKVVLRVSGASTSGNRVIYEQRQPWGESLFEHWVGETWGWVDGGLVAVIPSMAGPQGPRNAVQRITIINTSGDVLYQSLEPRPAYPVLRVSPLN